MLLQGYLIFIGNIVNFLIYNLSVNSLEPKLSVYIICSIVVSVILLHPYSR